MKIVKITPDIFLADGSAVRLHLNGLTATDAEMEQAVQAFKKGMADKPFAADETEDTLYHLRYDPANATLSPTIGSLNELSEETQEKIRNTRKMI